MEMQAGKLYRLVQEDMDSINKAVNKVQETAGGKVFAIIYLKLLLLSALDNNVLSFDSDEESFCEEIANIIDERPHDVMFALSYLEELNLLEEV